MITKTLKNITKVLMLSMLLLSCTSKVHCTKKTSQSTVKKVLGVGLSTLALGWLAYYYLSGSTEPTTYTIHCLTEEFSRSWWTPWKTTTSIIETTATAPTRELAEKTYDYLTSQGENCTIIAQ